jgi:alkaline phosphatase D
VRRRDLLLAAGAAGTISVLGGAARDGRAAGQDLLVGPARRPDTGLKPRRIAFGSCAKQDKPQPIWEAVLATEPDLFVFLGDNVYGDTRDETVLRRAYARLAEQPGFRRLCANVPVVATWDDHDFGENDAGGDYPMKQASRRIFCDFWGEAATSPRRAREGIHDALLFEHDGRRLQLLLPDLRYNRTPIRTLDLGGRPYKEWAKALEQAGREVPGPYEREPSPAATMLGEAQWQWLEAELAKPAEVRVFASSLQVVADFPGWEAWINYAEDHQRLLQAIRRQRADGLVCISGDTHYAELSRLVTHAPYPLWDLTSSGLTEVWPVTPPNARRLGSIVREPNFGLIEVDWDAPAPRLRLQARAADGRVRIEQRLDVGELAVGR